MTALMAADRGIETIDDQVSFSTSSVGSPCCANAVELNPPFPSPMSEMGHWKVAWLTILPCNCLFCCTCEIQRPGGLWPYPVQEYVCALLEISAGTVETLRLEPRPAAVAWHRKFAESLMCIMGLHDAARLCVSQLSLGR